ncbi:hypothetical protein AB6O49_10250 [Streptomyces sp. SBR177]
MRTRIRRRLLAGIAGTLLAMAGATSIAFAAGAPAALAINTAEEIPPSTVETFGYPNAAQILSQQGILLKKGTVAFSWRTATTT